MDGCMTISSRQSPTAGSFQGIAAVTLAIATTGRVLRLPCSRPTVETCPLTVWCWRMEALRWLLEPTDIATTAIATVLATAAADREES